MFRRIPASMTALLVLALASHAPAQSVGGPMLRWGGPKVLFLICLLLAPGLADAQFRLIPATAGAAQADGHSNTPRASADGKRVVFVSKATNLVSQPDLNGQDDIYLWDNTLWPTGRPKIIRVSTSSGGTAANGPSWDPAISANGEWVAFASSASNLVTGDTNNAPDIFVRKIETGEVTRASRTYTGGQPTYGCGSPSIDNNGIVVFDCIDDSMVAGDTNGVRDIFRAFPNGSQIQRVSTTAAGGQATGGYSQRPSISADGWTVAFESYATNLAPSESASSHNNAPDVFVKVFANGHLHHVSAGRGGARADGSSLHPCLSADGTVVVFESEATNLITSDKEHAASKDVARTYDVFLHDIAKNTTTRVTTAPDGSATYGIDATVDAWGHFVAYSVGNHVQLWEDTTRTSRRVSMRGAQNGDKNDYGSSLAPSTWNAIVVFSSDSTMLVDGDTNNRADIFLREVARTPAKWTPTTILGDPPRRRLIRVEGPHMGLADAACRMCLFTPELPAMAAATLSAAPTVTVGGQPAAGVQVIGENELWFATPPLSAGTSHKVLITYSDGEQVALPGVITAVAMPPPVARDDDHDGLPDEWELVWGLDPAVANAAPADADGDGLTDAQELVTGHHPNNTATRYLAEGSTGDMFQTRIALANPSVLPATALLRFLKGDGSLATQPVVVPATGRATVDVETLPGMTTADFATTIESDLPLIVDRTMRWMAAGGAFAQQGHYGSHTERSVTAPATTWYLAEGATHSGFDLFYLLQNPGGATANVEVTYLLPKGAPLVRTYSVGPSKRSNIWVNLEDPALASTDVSAVLRVTNDVPIIVERAMYRTGGGRMWTAGHESAGVTAPALNWFLAEGNTGPFFDLFVLIANPNAQDAAITARFLLADGTVITKEHVVTGNSRFNIWVDYEDAQLADAAVSTTIEVTNGVPVIVERAMWWPGPFATWHEAHNSPGSTETGTLWGVAEGEVGGSEVVETYLLIANTSAFDGQARVTLLFEDGTTAATLVPLKANSRTNVQALAAFGNLVVGKRFGATVESLAGAGGTAQIVVERAMYSSGGGVPWSAGTNALATRLR